MSYERVLDGGRISYNRSNLLVEGQLSVGGLAQLACTLTEPVKQIQLLEISVPKVRPDRYPKFPRFITGGLRMR